MKKFTLLLACNLILLFAHAQWQRHYIQYSNGDTGDGSVAVMDYNGDGWKDVIVAMQYKPELVLFKNNALGLPEVVELTDTLYTSTFVQAADINQDGYEDFLLLASSEWGNTFIYYYRNDGNYNYEVIPLMYAGYDDLIRKLEVVDMDMDGDMDILVDFWANINVLHYIKNIDETNFEYDWIDFDTQPVRLYGVAHFNDDDLPDFAYSRWDFETTDYIIGVAENLGNFTFTFHEFIHVDYEGQGILGEFTGDNKIDFALAHQATGVNALIMRNNGNFNFTNSGNLPINSGCTFGPMVDYDEDGDTDILASEGGLTSVLLRGANATYTIQNLLDTWLPVRNYIDMNNDGEKELMTGAQFGSQFDFFKKNGTEFTFWTNNYSRGAQNITIMDGNNDGLLDIYGKYSGNYEVNSNRQFFNGMLQPSERLVVEVPQPVSSIEQLIPFDKGNDGDIDYLYMSDWELNWAINNGNGFTFSNIQDVDYAYNFWIGYLDNDANHDILLCTGDFKRYEASGNNYTSTTITGGYEYFDVVDIDGDGDKDIPYLNYDQHLRYQRNNGNSFTDLDLADFTTALTSNFTMYAFAMRPQFVANDLDSDGDMDFVLCDPEQDKLWWIENDNFTFSIATISSTIDRPSDFSIGDFDMDGDKDIVAIATDDKQLLLFDNDGSENFTVITTINTTIGHGEVVAIDWDNDSDLDIFSTGFLFGDILWFENNAVDCPTSYSYTEATICPADSVLFGDNYFSLPGIYLDSLIAIAGCDSVAALMLSNHPVTAISISYANGSCTATSGFAAYSWYLNGQLISAATTNTISVATYGAGNYVCVGLDNNGCSNASNTFNANPDNILQTGVALFELMPNPASTLLTIKNLPTSASTIQILDVTGKCVGTFPACSQIHIAHLPAGIYTLLITGNDWSSAAKWVKE